MSSLLAGMMGLMLSATCVAGDRLLPPAADRVRLLGRIGESADRCLQARAYSQWSRGAMYDECVNSFRTHWDDAGENCGWQNEYWGKTMLCFAGAAAYARDPEMKHWIVEQTHAFLKEFQHDNGYLSTYGREDFLRRHPESQDAKEHSCFNVWGRKYTMWALVEIYRVTGDRQSLAAAEKMADHLIAQLNRLGISIRQTGYWHGISSMSILSPVLELYRITGKESYLDFAREIVQEMDRAESGPAAIIRDAFRREKIWTWYPEPMYWAKAYEIMSCLEGLVDYYRMTGEKRVLDAVLAYHRHLVNEELNPMRSVGLVDHFTDARHRVNAMTELCDAVYWIRLNRSLLLLTGESMYADLLEEAFYNAFLAGVWRDGRWGAHIVRAAGTRHVSAPPQTGMFEHQCCPDNMMRAYFDIAGSLAAKGADETTSVILYSDAKVDLPGVAVEISGGYPWGETSVLVKVNLEKAGKIRFRIPYWSKSLVVNGKERPTVGGWHETVAPRGESTWKLLFDMSPRMADVPCGREFVAPQPSPRSYTDVMMYVSYFMEWMTPDMRGLIRHEPAMTVMRGPLVLAKGRLTGTSRDETLFATSLRGQGWKASLEAMPADAENAGVSSAWLLTFERGVEKKRIRVSDFASVSNIDDPSNWFSIWF